jgi:hypothetical protein
MLLSSRDRRKRSQRVLQRLAVELQRAHVVVAEEAGEDALHHLAVGQHVRRARRHAQVVLQHGEAPVGEADQVGAGDGDVDAVGDIQPAHLAAVVLAAVDQVEGDDPVD